MMKMENGSIARYNTVLIPTNTVDIPFARFSPLKNIEKLKKEEEVTVITVVVQQDTITV
jgi:hypothetical protein